MSPSIKYLFRSYVAAAIVLGALAGSAIAQDFSLTATAPQPFAIGSSVTSTVTLVSLNGFNQSVALSVTGCPANVTCSFSPASLAPTSTGSTSTLTIAASATAAAPATSVLTITGTSSGAGALVRTAPPITLSMQATAGVKAATQPAAASSSDILKNNFGFGVALGLSVNVTGPSIVNNATVDANGFVRVNTRANTAAGFMLESHYFIWPKPPSDAMLKATNEDPRWWGTGPFVAAQPGSSQIISAVGAGWMIGFRRPKGSTPSGFGLGVGYEAIPAAQTLGSEFIAGQKAPLGPNGQPLPIRYETQDKGSVLVILSVAF